jgi:hypothetical protein
MGKAAVPIPEVLRDLTEPSSLILALLPRPPGLDFDLKRVTLVEVWPGKETPNAYERA